MDLKIIWSSASHNKMEIYLNLLSNKTAMISHNLDHQQKTYTRALFLRVSEWVSEWLLFNANAAIFQLYHGENKLIFNEMMMRSALY